MMGQSDNELVKEIIYGNQSAMELLVKRHYSMVQSFVYRLTEDYTLSYDITQEIFIKMMKGISRYDYNRGLFKPWILKIASNHCKDYFRTSTYKHQSEISNIDEIDIKSDENIIDILEHKEDRRIVKSAVDSLPTLQREAIILKYYHNFKIKEISSITGDAENTIKSRLFSGIKNLKNILEVKIMKKTDMRDDDYFDNEISEFLNLYTTEKVPEEMIDITIDSLRQYMPPKKEKNTLLTLISNELTYINKSYFIAATILVIISLAFSIECNINQYKTLMIISPLPMILGMFQIVKSTRNNM